MDPKWIQGEGKATIRAFSGCTDSQVLIRGCRLISEAAMTAPLSQDLRKRLVAAVAEGSSARAAAARFQVSRSEEHTSELQSLMRISYAVFCLKKKKKQSKILINNNRIKKYKRDQKNIIIP